MQRETKLSVLSFRSMLISSKAFVVLIVSMSDSARLPIFEIREITKLRIERFGSGIEKLIICEMKFEKGAKLTVLWEIFDMRGSGAHETWLSTQPISKVRTLFINLCLPCMLSILNVVPYDWLFDAYLFCMLLSACLIANLFPGARTLKSTVPREYVTAISNRILTILVKCIELMYYVRCF